MRRKILKLLEVEVPHLPTLVTKPSMQMMTLLLLIWIGLPLSTLPTKLKKTTTFL
jgi:hypothetical protein